MEMSSILKKNIVYLAPFLNFEDVYCSPSIQGYVLKYIKKEYPNLKKRSLAKDTCNVCDDLTVSDVDRERHKQAAISK